MKCHPRLSGDPEGTVSEVAGVGMALRVDAALLEWIPVDRQLCTARLGGSSRVNNRRLDRSNLFVISTHVPTGCGPDTVKERSLTYNMAKRHSDFGRGHE